MRILNFLLAAGVVSASSFVATPSFAQNENYCKVGNSLSMRCLIIKAQAEESALRLDDWTAGIRQGPKPSQHICVMQSKIETHRYSVAANCVLRIGGEQPKPQYESWNLPGGKTVEQLRRELGIK